MLFLNKCSICGNSIVQKRCRRLAVLLYYRSCREGRERASLRGSEEHLENYIVQSANRVKSGCEEQASKNRKRFKKRNEIETTKRRKVSSSCENDC